MLKSEGSHEAFRLWVTAEPHSAFPIGLLQMGIKITNEAPVGIRAGLRASYQWITQARMPCLNPLMFFGGKHSLVEDLEDIHSC